MIGAYVVMPVSLSDERAIFYLVLDVAVDCKPSAHRNGRGAAATERPRRLARQRADRAARQLFGHSMARRLARASPRGGGGGGVQAHLCARDLNVLFREAATGEPPRVPALRQFRTFAHRGI